MRKHCANKLTFLDAGCGPGITLAMAYSIGFNHTIGVEIDPATVKIARLINPSAKIVKKDIRLYKGYNKADVIYYFVPISNAIEERKFEMHLAMTMRIGAAVVPVGSSWYFEHHRKKEFKGIQQGNFYVKTKEIVGN
jgi:SAM-dependent methyltransferase